MWVSSEPTDVPRAKRWGRPYSRPRGERRNPESLGRRATKDPAEDPGRREDAGVRKSAPSSRHSFPSDGCAAGCQCARPRLAAPTRWARPYLPPHGEGRDPESLGRRSTQDSATNPADVRGRVRSPRPPAAPWQQRLPEKVWFGGSASGTKANESGKAKHNGCWECNGHSGGASTKKNSTAIDIVGSNDSLVTTISNECR